MNFLTKAIKDEITINIDNIDVTDYIINIIKITIKDNYFIFYLNCDYKNIIEYIQSFNEINNTLKEILTKNNIKISYNYSDMLIYKCPIDKYYQNNTKFSISSLKIFSLIDKNDLDNIYFNIINIYDSNLKILYERLESTELIEKKLNNKIKLIESNINLNFENKFKDLNDKCLILELKIIQLNKENKLIKLNNQKQKTYFFSFCLIGLLFVFFNYLEYQSQFPYLSKRKYVHYK